MILDNISKKEEVCHIYIGKALLKYQPYSMQQSNDLTIDRKLYHQVNT